MLDQEKTKEDLIAEVNNLRRRIAQMESRQNLEGRSYSWIEAEELYLSLIAEALFGYYVIQDGRFHFVNPKMVEIFGYTVEEMLEQVGPLDIVHPDDRKITEENIQLRLNGSLGSASYNLKGLRKDGSNLYVQVTGSRIIYRGRPAVHGNIIDITARKKAETALRQSENDLRQQVDYLNTLMQSLNELFYTYDPEGFLTFINRKSKEVLGYEPHELLGLNVKDFVPADLRQWVEQGMHRILQEGKSLSYEMPVIYKDGSQRLIRFNSAPIIVEDAITGAMVLAEDITDRRQAEEALAAEKEWLAVTLRSIGEGVVTTDTDGTIILINDVAEKISGWSQAEAMGKPIEQVFRLLHRNTRQSQGRKLIEKLQTHPLVELESQILIRKDGQERFIEASGARIRNLAGRFIGAVVVFRDIAARIRMEQELIKTSKLESLGVLAGGIAHDFNNLLTVIMGYITLAKISMDDPESVLELLAKSEKASWQTKALTQQLLTFAKGGAPLKKTLSLVDLIKDSVEFTLSGSNLKCELAVPDGLWPVEADEGQLSQVINNLVINALQAMPQGGTIRVTAGNVALDETSGIPLESGNYVIIKIQDEGVGIPEVHHQKIFDPYFTTKPTGSGLGLATAYSIIKNHEGFIGVESREGQGTTFSIYLPISREVPHEASSIAFNPAAGQGRILVMDDGEDVREVVERMLKAIGYEATTVGAGQEAVRLYREALRKGLKFDAAIIDLTIPGSTGGKEVINELLAMDPEVKAIVSSGYSNDPIMAEYSKWGFRGVVSKPFGIGELSQTLKMVLGERADRPPAD